jgi:macrolide transport system ATP-binding/permease protein
MDVPLLEVRRLRRDFTVGGQTVAALKDIDLSIHAGEMVAIVGQSGSGKSTLMNILGCLDRPSSGSYRIAGRDVATLGANELARLRREHFGFVFQRYHLIGTLNAVGNVEVPAVYARRDRAERREHAGALLRKLGLGGRLDHRPAQLSGGQQQRVSIARALMNGGQVILADEPTGALDRQSGAEMLAILEALHAEGHTIIIVTHDLQVASHAGRIVEISDGAIVADRVNPRPAAARPSGPAPAAAAGRTRSLQAYWDEFAEALRMAFAAMMAHRARTFLTMLGIIIGIASVASVVALGEGTRQEVLKNINGLGTNTVSIYPGSGFGDVTAWRIHTLTAEDADALAQQGYVDSVSPSAYTQLALRYGSLVSNAVVTGVGEQYFRVQGVELMAGSVFGATEVRERAQTVVIDTATRKTLFPNGGDPLGQVILLGKVPCRIIGVAKPPRSFGDNQNLRVYLPYTTVLERIMGQSYLGGISVRISDNAPVDLAQAVIERLIELRHGRKDFFLFNEDAFLKTIQSTSLSLELLVSAIAAITLLVGGIGLMNIMLVSVIERTREIGIRTAVGARRSDIMAQFLIEAVLVCLIGGALGILLALGLGWAFSHVQGPLRMVFSTSALLAAFAVSTLVGVVFGFLPARNAARLDPVETLARD